MKKTLSVILAVVLAFALAACGGTTESTVEEETAAETAELETLTVGASSTPHAEILEAVRDVLAEEGFDLDVIIMDDYVLPNTALEEGSLDANYFQHTPYLNSFNAENGTHLIAAAAIHYEPFGLYANGVASVEETPEGATIIIPADDSNETRALLLLQQEGLITLPEDANASDGVTTLDIVDDKGYNIVPVTAENVTAQLANSDEGTLAVVNGNYALAAGLDINDALAVEDASGDAAQTYANVIAVKEGNESSDKTLALIKALTSDEAKTFIEETYNGAVLPIF